MPDIEDEWGDSGLDADMMKEIRKRDMRGTEVETKGNKREGKKGLYNNPNNLLGNSALFSPVAVGGVQPKSTIINVEMDTPFSLEVHLQAIPINHPSNRPSPLAIVQYGTEGAQNEFKCDIRQGTTFIVPASFLRVIVTEPLGAAGIGGGASGFGQMKIQGCVSYAGGVSKVTPIRFTDYTLGGSGAIAAAGVTTPVEIVPFSTQVEFQRAPAAAPFTIQFLTRSLALIYEEAVAVGQSGGPFDIGGDASFIQIVNGGVPIANSRIMFNLEV